MKIKLICDSLCDIPKEIQNKEYLEVVPLTIIFNDKEYNICLTLLLLVLIMDYGVVSYLNKGIYIFKIISCFMPIYNTISSFYRRNS